MASFVKARGISVGVTRVILKSRVLFSVRHVSGRFVSLPVLVILIVLVDLLVVLRTTSGIAVDLSERSILIRVLLTRLILILLSRLLLLTLLLTLVTVLVPGLLKPLVVSL